MIVPIAEFVGNAGAARRLAAEARDDGAQAYLLTGAEQVGKRTLALAVAALATCDAPSGPDACARCASCAAAARGAHPDVHVVERRDERRTIVVEQAQEVARHATVRPYQSDRKVFVIVDADALEERAANLLLKTIEEPAPDTRLVLTSGDGDGVLPTIRSRCREVALRPVAPDVIAGALAARGVEPQQADLLARLAAGRPGWAFAAAADPGILARRSTHLETLSAALGRRRSARLPIADRLDDPRNLARARAEIAGAFALWISWWRDVLVVRGGCEDLAANVDRLDELKAVARQYDVMAITAAIGRTRLAASHLDDNVNPRLVVESLFLDLPDATAP